MKENTDSLSIIVGKQLTSLLSQSGLTITGLAFGIKMSLNHLRVIKSGKAHISSKTAEKISNFFEIEVEALFSSKKIKLKKPSNIHNLRTFYEENQHNPKFFISRQKENSVADFLKKILLLDSYLLDEHTVGEIKEYCQSSKYKRKFEGKELSRELSRLAKKGALIKRDKFKNGTVFLYKKSVL